MKEYTRKEIHKAIEDVWKSQINPRLKKDIFDLLIWRITEINGKYNTKYRSKEALSIKDIKNLHHEHVFSRKTLKENLVNAKSLEEVKEVLNKVEACVITREEHKKLKNDFDGRERYKRAGIEILKIR